MATTQKTFSDMNKGIIVMTQANNLIKTTVMTKFITMHQMELESIECGYILYVRFSNQNQIQLNFVCGAIS